MSRVLVVVACVLGSFAGVAHAQDPAGDLPPAPLAEPAPGYDYEPPATPVPTPAPDTKSKVDPKTAPPPATNSGMDPLLLGFLQCGAGYLAASVVSATIIGSPLAPAANGYVQTWVGNALGQQVAPALVPIIAAYGAQLITVGGIVASYFALIGGGFVIAASNVDPFITVAIVVGVILLVVATVAVSFLPVPIAYNIVSRPREEDDDHTGLPGLLEVSKKPREGVKAQARPRPRALAMAY